MADETLRMNAVVTDGFTSPLQALNKLLSQVGLNQSGKQVAKDWEGVSARINKVALDIRTGLQPVMSGLGVASLGVSGAIAGIGLALKNVAFNTRDLSLFSKGIGLSVNQLRQLKAVGERFGIDWGQTQSSLKQFAGNMDQLQRRWGEAYDRLRGMKLGDLAEKLVSAPNMQAAIDRALEGVKSIQNPVRRREIAQLLFGSDQWATVARELTPTRRAEIEKLTAKITPEMQAASDKFVKNWQDMQQAVDNFVVQGLGPALPKITEYLEQFNKLVEPFWKESFTTGLKKLDQSMPVPFGPLDGLEFGPEDNTYWKRDRAEKLKKQIENADRAIGLGDGRGEDTTRLRSRRDELAEQLRKLTEEIKQLRREGGATVQQQSFDGIGGGVAGMIQRAAMGASGLGGGAGGGGSPFSPGFWGGIYRGGVGGDPFRGAGRTWDRQGGGGAGGQQGSGGRGVTNAPSLNPDVSPGSGINRPRGIDAGPGRQTDPSNPIKGFANLMRGQFGGPGENLVSIKTPSGRSVTVHREAGEAFKGFLGDLEGAGYNIGSLGGYHMRGQANGSGRLSQHAYGNAIDINPGANPYMRSQTDMPKNISDMAAKWGLSWGGDWSARYRDPMHFEWTGARPWLGKPGPTPTADDRPSGTGMPFGLTGDRLTEIERRRDALSGVRRTGDSMMARAFGAGGVAAGAPRLDAKGSVNITLSGGLEKMPARVSMDGLFKDVQVNRKIKVSDKGRDD